MKKNAWRLWVALAATGLGLLGVVPRAPQAQPAQGAIRAGTLPPRWDTAGPRCAEMPEWQIHEYNPDLYILRQSGCTDFEKPFVFLLFGGERALLLDTGSRRGNLAPTPSSS
jgi:hydroxyacylglutathione hydrolase